MLKVEGLGEGPVMTETEVRVIVRVSGTMVAALVVEVTKSVAMRVLRLTDCVTVIVGVLVKVLSVRMMFVIVLVVEGSTTVSMVWLGVGVAMSRQLQASETPARPELTSNLRRHRGRPKTCRFSLPKPSYGAVIYGGGGSGVG